MSQRDDVLRILGAYPGGLTDAEVARELKRLHPKAVHQTANIVCRKLADDGLIVRDDADRPIVNRLRSDAPAPSRTPTGHASAATPADKPWPWEGAVQALIVDWLAAQGGHVVSQVDTASRERGTDVVAELDGRRLHIEVKGWASRDYADPRRAGETKPTHPTMQAAHWFAGALSAALKLRHSHPEDRVVVAVPDFSRYRSLHAERADPLQSVGVEVWVVAESGTVEVIGETARPIDQSVDSDSPVKRVHREHQSRWRRDVLGLPAGPPSSQVRDRYPTLGNFLPESHAGSTAAEAGWNLMSPAAQSYTHERLATLARAHGLAETDRLWRNMLSSQPLAFSIAGELRVHPGAAVAVFGELTGLPVVGLDRLGESGDAYLLDGVEAEWSPPRAEHTGDRSGFDIAAVLGLADNRRMLVTIEVKYVDGFSPARLEPARYREHLETLGMSTNTVEDIVSRGGSQFLRSVLLTESVRRRGLRGEVPLDHALSVVLARVDDPQADAVVELLAGRGLRVARWTHSDLFDAARRQPELAEWARQMRRRYVPDGPRT